MRVFVSYSRTQQARARSVDAALNAAGFDTFLDEHQLPVGEEYNARIRRWLNDADLFVFLADADAVRADSYAMTELEWAREQWPNPSGRVLPVTLAGLDPVELPPYLRAVTAMRGDEGNLEARIVAWVEDRAESGTSVPGVRSPRETLERWARLAKPPLRKGRRVFHARAVVAIPFGLAFIAFGFLATALIDSAPQELGPLPMFIPIIPMLVGAGLILYAIRLFLQGLRGGEGPIPVLVLHRSTTSNNLPTLELETIDRGRITVEPIGSRLRKLSTGDMGWAWIRGGMMLDFVPASGTVN